MEKQTVRLIFMGLATLDVSEVHGMTLVSCCSNVEGFGLEAEARMTTWHVMMPSENEADTQQSQDVSEGTTVCHNNLTTRL